MGPIEEAYAIVGERCWWRSRTDDSDQDHVQAEQKAVRAALMAVHDDACWACSRGLKECPKRRRIAALGVGDGR